jgi:FAD/FMN-containing dehydrogenase
MDEHDVITINDSDKVAEIIGENGRSGLAYGMGRSYGDVCLNSGGRLWDMSGLDHFMEFDDDTGHLTCEAGVLLRDIQRLVIPRGWILPVTPGTQIVTVGGAIACDVHGKSHHIHGSFGNHVKRIKIIRTNGEIIDCGPNERSDWFAATVGGIGLTGIIVQAEIQLQRVVGPWLDAETIPYADLNEFFSLSDESGKNWENTVAWIDCLTGKGRGLFMRGNTANTEYRQKPKEYKLTMPFEPPISLVNGLSLRLFNMAYYNLNKMRAKRSIVYYETFFYPLDNILEWNRMYGARGFFQYQSVVPRNVGQDAVQAMLKEIENSGTGSFLAVLKTFGDRPSVGMMSFPRSGVTLALDFPNRRDRTHKLFSRIDDIVREAGGCIYLAKDACMPRDLFESGYPRLTEFLKYRDPGISSGLSRRLIGN